MHRVVQVMRYGTPLPRYPGSLAACERVIKNQGGHLEYHCPVHGWVVGRRCPSCYREGIG